MDAFECVLALAEFRNLTRASEYLFMTQPALTLKIQRLEKELGIKIFDRSTRPISITSAGRLYIREMSKIHMAQNQLYSQLQALSNQQVRTVTIAIGFNRGRNWLPGFFPILLQRNPQYSFQIREDSDHGIEQMVRTGEADFGIIASPVISEEFCVQEIIKERILIGIPSSSHILSNLSDKERYTMKNPYTIELRELNGETLILGQDSYGLSRHINLLFSAYRLKPGNILRVGNIETSYLLAAKGIGITFLFDGYHTEPLESGMERPIPCVLRNIPLERMASLIYKGSENNEDLKELILNAIKEFLQNRTDME